MYLKDKKVDQNEVQLVFVKLGNFLKIFTSISYFMKNSTNVPVMCSVDGVRFNYV